MEFSLSNKRVFISRVSFLEISMLPALFCERVPERHPRGGFSFFADEDISLALALWKREGAWAPFGVFHASSLGRPSHCPLCQITALGGGVCVAFSPVLRELLLFFVSLPELRLKASLRFKPTI